MDGGGGLVAAWRGLLGGFVVGGCFWRILIIATYSEDGWWRGSSCCPANGIGRILRTRGRQGSQNVDLSVLWGSRRRAGWAGEPVLLGARADERVGMGELERRTGGRVVLVLASPAISAHGTPPAQSWMARAVGAGPAVIVSRTIAALAARPRIDGVWEHTRAFRRQQQVWTRGGWLQPPTAAWMLANTVFMSASASTVRKRPARV